MPREGRRRKRKERSNKEVDISSVGAGALNTFLLHFNGFLKSIFMQIKACLSRVHKSQAWGWLPEPSLSWDGWNLLPFLKGHAVLVPLLAACSLCRHAGHLTPTAWYHYTLNNCGCSLQPKQAVFPRCHCSAEDQACWPKWGTCSAPGRMCFSAALCHTESYRA